jgi:hypothetical protein
MAWGVVPLGSITEHKRYRNIRNNLQAVKDRVAYPEEPYVPVKPVTIVCYGPSLKDTWHLIHPVNTIVSVSKAHDFLVDHGIAPAIHVEFDCRSHKAKHIQHASQKTLYYLASCVHPDVVKKTKHCPTYLWHAAQKGGEDDRAITAFEPGAKLIPGGGSVGLRAIELLYALGFRHFDIHGMDSSFADNGRTQWAGPHFGTSKGKRDILETICGGQRFYTSLAFASYATQFLQCRRHLHDATFKLYGEGLLQTMALEDQRIGEAA